MDAFFSTASKEGMKGLWRGTTTSMARAALLSGSQLATYDRGKTLMKTHGGWTEGYQLHLCCAALSGLAAQTACMPADTIKTRYMASARGGLYGSPLSCLRQTIASEGPAGLYRGYLPALARQAPVMVIQMPIVEQIRRLVGLDYF